MANSRCITALKQNSFDIKVGEILDSTHDAVVKWPSYFTTDQSGVDWYTTGTIAVTVPAISGTAVLPTDSVVVDISSDPLTFVAAVGDAVFAIPLEALESDCLLVGAYVVGNDSIEVVFAAKEGGDGVTSAAKNFKFHIADLT